MFNLYVYLEYVNFIMLEFNMLRFCLCVLNNIVSVLFDRVFMRVFMSGRDRV